MKYKHPLHYKMILIISKTKKVMRIDDWKAPVHPSNQRLRSFPSTPKDRKPQPASIPFPQILTTISQKKEKREKERKGKKKLMTALSATRMLARKWSRVQNCLCFAVFECVRVRRLMLFCFRPM